MKNNSTSSKGWEKEIKNYECREYDGIKWIRYDHYLDALASQLKEVVGVIKKQDVFVEGNRNLIDVDDLITDITNEIKNENKNQIL